MTQKKKRSKLIRNKIAESCGSNERTSFTQALNDTVIFMSAYKTTNYLKSKRIFRKKASLPALLDKHHLLYLLTDEKLISSKGTLKLHTEYNYAQQETSFSFSPIDKEVSTAALKEIIKRTDSCIKLLHAQSILSDPLYFKIDFFVYMEQFVVYIGEHVYQIDPVIFSLNSSLIIAFEVIDFETGIPLKKGDVLGKKGNYNLLTVNGYQYFGENSIIPSNGKISEIIYNNLCDFFSNVTKKSFTPEIYSFIHNTLVLSNDVDDITNYICNLIGTRELPSPLINISTTENYQYYPQDGIGFITKYDSNNVDVPLFNGIILESIKIYIYLTQIINLEIQSNINSVIRNDLYIENLFFAPHIPIETHHLLSYIYKTDSFSHHKEATKLKISYLTAENESKKSRNSVLLNILLYIISLMGTVGTLDTLENQLGIPFEYSFFAVILIFTMAIIIWSVFEWRQNKRF